jgi:peptidoglycan/xylan/chitin deacetylase (PgdA/CDA1 family)
VESVHHELVLNFHGIGTPHRGVGPAEQAVWMSRQHFVGVLDHIAALREAQEIPIAITFDDGNASDVTFALPELCKRGLAATFFVCAGRLDTPEYLSPLGLRDLLRSGMRVGSHGMHHRDWRKLDEAGLADEVSAARMQLEDACGQPVSEAAIPFGSYDRRVLDKLRAAGFACAYTSDGGFARRGAWLRPRNTLGAGSGPEDVTRLLVSERGLYTVLRGARKFYKRLR